MSKVVLYVVALLVSVARLVVVPRLVRVLKIVLVPNTVVLSVCDKKTVLVEGEVSLLVP